MEDDLSFLADFRQESNDGLESVERLLLAMERGDQEAVNALFRVIHSIKGGAGFIDLPDVRRLAHELEYLLDLFRSGRKQPDSSITDLMLGSVDLLRALINGHGGVTAAQIEHQISLIRAHHDPEAASPPPPPSPPSAGCEGIAMMGIERFGRFLIARGLLSSEQVLDALIAQDWAALKPINVLRDRLGLGASTCLDILDQAEESGQCCLAIAEQRGLLHGRSITELRSLIRNSRPALGQILVQMGCAEAGSVREWVREYLLQRLNVPSDGSRHGGVPSDDQCSVL